MKNRIVVEWSPSQKCFHTETEKVSEMFITNARVFKRKSMTDYLPIGFFESNEDATEFIRNILSHK